MFGLELDSTNKKPPLPARSLIALQLPCLDPLDLLHLHLLLVGGGLDVHLDGGARVVFHGQWPSAVIGLIGASPHTWAMQMRP